MTFISNKTLLRLSVYISSTGYLEDESPHFIKVTKYDNIGFDRKLVEDKDGEEDGKEEVMDSEEKASKKKA